MRINRNLRNLGLVFTAAFVCLGAQAVASAQNDRSDRPGPEEGRTTRSERHDDRVPDRRGPAAIAREQLNKFSTAARAGGSRTLATMTGVASEADLRQTFERAMQDYEQFVAGAGSNYIAVRMEDFAPAYYIVKDPRVRDKRSDGLALAQEVATLKYTSHYAKFLNEELRLDKNTAKEIEKAAREVVKSFGKQ